MPDLVRVSWEDNFGPDSGLRTGANVPPTASLPYLPNNNWKQTERVPFFPGNGTVRTQALNEKNVAARNHIKTQDFRDQVWEAPWWVMVKPELVSASGYDAIYWLYGALSDPLDVAKASVVARVQVLQPIAQAAGDIRARLWLYDQGNLVADATSPPVIEQWSANDPPEGLLKLHFDAFRNPSRIRLVWENVFDSSPDGTILALNIPSGLGIFRRPDTGVGMVAGFGLEAAAQLDPQTNPAISQFRIDWTVEKGIAGPGPTPRTGRGKLLFRPSVRSFHEQSATNLRIRQAVETLDGRAVTLEDDVSSAEGRLDTLEARPLATVGSIEDMTTVAGTKGQILVPDENGGLEWTDRTWFGPRPPTDKERYPYWARTE